MPMINCYVDDETMARLRAAARSLHEMTHPNDADVHEKVVTLAENAIGEAAIEWARSQPVGQS